MEQQKCGLLGVFLDKIVSDIFDSSSSSSDEDEDLVETLSETIGEDDVPVLPYTESVMPTEDNEPVLEKLRQNTTSKYFQEVETKQGVIDILLSTCSHREFREYFKISRATFEFILEFLKYDLICKGSHCHEGLNASCKVQMPPALQLLLTLRKMCSLDSYSEVCRIFGVTSLTAKLAVYRVAHALAERASTFISWPQGERLHIVCQGFQALSKIPKVTGALDSMLLTISGHAVGQEHCPPQTYSVHLQLVADHEGRFTVCSTGAIGKINKQEVFDNSLLRMFVSKPLERFPDDSHLVAGPDYELCRNVLVPFNGANLTAEQAKFNEHLKLAHNAVAKAISRLKTRFPSLDSTVEVASLEVGLRTYCQACIVLYNICLERKDLLGDPPFFVTQEFNTASPGTLSVASADALEKRDLLCKQLQLSETEGVCFV